MNRIITIVFLLSVWSCANRVSPTGGPKDEDPPELVRSMPEYGQRNYKDQVMELEFNEFISLKSLKEQLIITPRIDSEYEFRFKKKTVYIEFEEPFADSTTYTLNFRDGIVDITENQPAENLQIAFSTGNMLDTLEIFGSVINMFTEEPEKDITVGLYTIEDTLDIFTGPPYYFAQTDEEGHYHFRNIKDGKYRIYAFKDGNKNLTCQSANESYGFLDQPIAVDTIVFADTIRIEYMNIDTLEMTRVRPSGKYFNVLANKYLVDAKLTASNDSLLQYHFNDEKDGLVVYNTFKIKDSLEVYVQLQDSLNQIALDTFYLQFPESSRRPNEFEVNFDRFHASSDTKLITGSLTFTKPIMDIRLDSIQIFYDSTTQYSLRNNFEYYIDTLYNELEFTIIPPQPILDTIQSRKTSSQAKDLPSTKRQSGSLRYKLLFPKGSIYSIEQDTSDLLEKDISFTDASKTGVITGEIKTSYTSYIIQLLDKNYKLIKETGPGSRYKFIEVQPGEYFIRILIDADNNSTWDHSDIRMNRMAEPIFFYRDENGNNKTAVRANWEINVDLVF